MEKRIPLTDKEIDAWYTDIHELSTKEMADYLIHWGHVEEIDGQYYDTNDKEDPTNDPQ